MAKRKPVIEIVLCAMATYIRRLKNTDLRARIQESHPEFTQKLAKFLDLDGNNLLDDDELDKASKTVADLASLAGDFSQMQSKAGLQLEDPEELVARIGKMLRDPKMDRSKLDKLYPPFAGISAGEVARIGLLVENSPNVVIEALMRHEGGDFKKVGSIRDDLVVHARASGER